MIDCSPETGKCWLLDEHGGEYIFLPVSRLGLSIDFCFLQPLSVRFLNLGPLLYFKPFHDSLDNGEKFVDSCLSIVYKTHDYILFNCDAVPKMRYTAVIVRGALGSR